ncbi:MAG: 50S ribosomal protein L18 [Candidatus Doudnabacteria bacterium RIFCSPHIGHO2_01_52_17]|uniref:Large ribosomal subunit protein uL18 n=1 Tax=Candidatus Doudnabacteria bacterium RIFCSPHIGHO2_01_52_17 TaxID=1817820 RepID=A0A1F5N8H7_9BACT|nr:ribosomal protein L18 [uncultured bacterium]OGE73929.1 MAG: 50S ribosomal protein L18 [Candidatus Doudnabacteria bacterium RIFCSPHIGHO2_01_52_17]
MKPAEKRAKRIRRHRRVRARIFGTTERPRLSVFRSSQHLHLQLIDDTASRTIAAASTREVKGKHPKKDKATAAAKLLAERAKKAGITTAVFDRGGFQYHGRVKNVAEAMREAGIKI